MHSYYIVPDSRYAKGLANDLNEKQDSNMTDASPNGEKSLLDGEVDELIRWSDSLNFEDYWFEWKELATTANSDFSVRKYKQCINPWC